VSRRGEAEKAEMKLELGNRFRKVLGFLEIVGAT